MNRAVVLAKERKMTKCGIVEYWTARWFDSNGKRRSKAIGRVDEVSNRDARKKIVILENQFDTNPSKRNVGKSLTIGQLCKDYIESKEGQLEPATILKRKECQAYLLIHFNESKRIDQITPMDADKFKTALLNGKLRVKGFRKEKLAKTTINSMLVMAKALFTYAVDMELIPANPFRKVVMDVKESHDWHYVSVDEYHKIMEHAPQRLKLVIALCRLCGLRSGEALNLVWGNIDWTKNRIKIVGNDEWQPKDKDERTIPIPPELAKMLLEAYESAPDGQEKVIPDVYDGNLRRDFLAILKRAKLNTFDKPIHSLRKSCITDWSGRYPMHVVKEWAGHASITTTQKFYLKVSEDDYTKASKESFWTVKVDSTENGTENEKKTENEAVDTNKKAS